MCRRRYQDGEVLSVSGPLTIHKWATYERKWAIYDAKVGHLLVLNSVVRIAYRNHENIKKCSANSWECPVQRLETAEHFLLHFFVLATKHPKSAFFVVSEILRTYLVDR